MAMVARVAKFYRPDEPPNEEESTTPTALEPIKAMEIRRLHEYYNHPSVNEMKRMANKWFGDLEITTKDIEIWHSKEGKFCSGCVEGKLKEHARNTFTKPLTATKPGENGVADLMFIEGRHGVKIPFYVHVDVATKLIMGYAMKDKTYAEALRAVEFIREQHDLLEHKLERLTFDRESSIVAMQEDIEARGIKLILKAAGQKVGLAEVSIRLVREKARATKAGVRAMYGYIPANQFNIDLCLDTISVLNRTVKDGYQLTPYEQFTGENIDYERDFRCRWGDLVIVKKPKGISSDLGVTGEWAMVVRRSMNKTGVLKVYLIGTRRFAYRLHFKRVRVPDWVTTIGFEDSTEETMDPGAGLIGESDPGDPNEATENLVQDWEDAPANYGDLEVGELDEAIRALEEADYQANAEEELREQAST